VTVGQVTAANVEQVFTYQKPREDQIPKFDAVRAAAVAFAKAILDNCPGCADTSAALRMVRDARMTANAAIALDGAI
jgi:hypothetical protein